MARIKQTLAAVFIVLSIGALATGCASNQRSGASGSGSAILSGTDTGVPAGEASFARQACQADVAEAEIGKLAIANTKNGAVRGLARKLVKDHMQAEKELAGIFTRKGIRPEPHLAESLQSSINHLAGLKGAAFDEAFKQQVTDDHQKAIPFFEKQVEQGTDPELKAFAQRLLPHLRSHLEAARLLPISSDTRGPSADGVNTILQNPASRIIVPP